MHGFNNALEALTATWPKKSEFEDLQRSFVLWVPVLRRASGLRRTKSPLIVSGFLFIASPHKVISGFNAFRQAGAPMAGLEPATEGSLQISGRTHKPLYDDKKKPTTTTKKNKRLCHTTLVK
ncbi:hypothetical protein PoB_007720000 [Plakobranchus ocellatus]|uniref:Uncharacterized protein n=1 Tax=Plakobranchus ocellatus TaxID=259542 RepID=A0AAV4E2T8_9GAST|nr:hypothetical protein PoB_007720000 [Plakobranchus ocellatus]